MLNKKSLDFANIELLDSGVFNVKLGERIILELENATELIDSCNQLVESDHYYGCILNMSDVAFVTEDARNYLTNSNSHNGNISGLGLVSSNHLGNIICTLMMSFCGTDSLPMKLFRNRFEAESWITSLVEKPALTLLNPS